MKRIINLILIFSIIVGFTNVMPVARAATEDELRQQINDLQQQIDANRATLSQKSKEASSLSNQVAIFDGQIRDAELQISKTQASIDQNQAEIVSLQNQITQKEKEIEIQKQNLFETIRVLYESGQNQSMVEIVVGSNSLSDAINQTQYLESLTSKINDSYENIKKIKAELENNKQEQEQKKKDLENLLVQQTGYRDSLDSQRAARARLLIQTKGQESEYQKKLEEARRIQAQAWAEYEAALSQSHASNGSNYIGGSGNGYLSSPSNGYLTQGYGCTTFARCGDPNGPYGGNIHNGLDISMGYPGPIKAAADGVVLDRGEEYNSHGWGNWIIIRHPNGLATLYGHLSSFRASVGQSISKGDVIGLEGNTGASTGSHLHFSVFTNLTIYNGAYHGPDYRGTVNPYNFL